MNRQIGVGDSKYVVVSDLLLLGHVIRRMRSNRIYSPAKVNEERFAYFLTTCEVSSLTEISTRLEVYTNI